jgi:hypothetical protein
MRVGRRKKNGVETPAANSHWVVSEEMTIHGRNVVRGTELSISGERGRFRFIKYVINGDIEWIDVVDKFRAIRSFRPESVKRVHYKNKIRLAKKPVE